MGSQNQKQYVKNISSFHNRDLLQAYLDNIVNWSPTWKLLFNHSKTVKLTFGLKGCHFSTTCYLENLVVGEKKTHKDLGVMVSSNLSWNNHYDNVAHKAYTMLSFLCCQFLSWLQLSQKTTLSFADQMWLTLLFTSLEFLHN